MNIIVCMKQIPDTNEVKIDQETGTLIREGVPSIINPDDRHAIEEAIVLRDKQKKGKVTVLSMGPPQAKDALREALAMGADEAILLSDRAFAGADTWSTSITIAGAIKAIGGYDIIFCGRQAIDGDTAQVGPQIAEHLDIPQITYVEKVKIDGKNILANRALEDGHYVIKAKMPVLLTAINKLNEPRYPSLHGINEVFHGDKDVKHWTLDDIKVDKTQIGLKGSPTRVKKSFTPSKKFEGEIIGGNPKDVAKTLIVRLKERNVL